MTEPIAQVWYARPVFFVSDVRAALRFHIDTLGFATKWHQGTVCQVDRGGCEIILCADAARRTGHARGWPRPSRDHPRCARPRQFDSVTLRRTSAPATTAPPSAPIATTFDTVRPPTTAVLYDT